MGALQLAGLGGCAERQRKEADHLGAVVAYLRGEGGEWVRCILGALPCRRCQVGGLRQAASAAGCFELHCCAQWACASKLPTAPQPARRPTQAAPAPSGCGGAPWAPSLRCCLASGIPRWQAWCALVGLRAWLAARRAAAAVRAAQHRVLHRFWTRPSVARRACTTAVCAPVLCWCRCPQVLDSPFSRLVDLMLELATSEQQLRIPKPLIKVGRG